MRIPKSTVLAAVSPMTAYESSVSLFLVYYGRIGWTPHVVLNILYNFLLQTMEKMLDRLI